MRLRSVAAAVTLVSGIWGIALGVYWNQIFVVGSGISCVHCFLSAPGWDVLVALIGLILVVDSALCFLSFSKAFYVSAMLSVLMTVSVALPVWSITVSPAVWGSYASLPFTLILGISTLVLDLSAATKKTYVAEADHPLNLPVFG